MNTAKTDEEIAVSVQKGEKSAFGLLVERYESKMLREAKYVSPEKFPFKSDITIYDDNIAISALEGKVVGVIITHKELANSFRALFNLLWSSL